MMANRSIVTNKNKTTPISLSFLELSIEITPFVKAALITQVMIQIRAVLTKKS